MNAVDWTMDQTDFIKMRSRELVYLPLKELDYNKKAIIKYVNIFGVSLLIIILGIVKYFIRKKKRVRV